MNKKVFLFLAEGFEEVEAITPIDLLRRAGIDCITVSVTDKLEVTGSNGITIKADRLFDEKECMTGDAIILPGGIPGTTNLSKHYGLRNVIIDYDKRKKLIAAICAAPTVLGEMGLLEGYKATCYPGFEDKLLGADALAEKYVNDRHFLTSRGVGTSTDFALQIIGRLEGEDKMNDIKNQIVFNLY